MSALIIWVLLGIFLIAACSNKPEQETVSSKYDEPTRETRNNDLW